MHRARIDIDSHFILFYSICTGFRDDKKIYSRNILIVLFIVNMVLNVGFFYTLYSQNLNISFIILFLLLISTLALSYSVYKINRISALLFIPYIISILFMIYCSWNFVG